MKKSIFTLIALMFVLTISEAQTIPNAGFENWTSMGSYDNPDGWSQLNSMTTSKSTYTCEKGTPGSVGTSYLKLTSKTVTGMGVIPGVAVCGMINTTTFQPTSGFAFTSRPAALTGKWQHMIFGSSQGFINIKLTRWDATTKKRITVASANQVLSGMAMSWASFSIPLTYMDNNAPDTCIIVLSASGSAPTNKDYLWVDNLAFSGSAGIKDNYLDTKITLYPNPSPSNLMIDLSAIKGQNVSLQIVDIQGKQIKMIEGVIGSMHTILDISDLSKGNYMLNIIANEGIVAKKFIKE